MEKGLDFDFRETVASTNKSKHRNVRPPTIENYEFSIVHPSMRTCNKCGSRNLNVMISEPETRVYCGQACLLDDWYDAKLYDL
jgi:hypothetical protein